jgi:NAD(P)-dependent dehydrogenase (short-subunit alcohol dehydrogenase family)
MEDSFAGRTVVMSGGSRGIGLAIAKEVAKRGGNIVMLAKTSEPDPRLPGTVHSAVEELMAAGGNALAVVGDVRVDRDVVRVVDTAVTEFGGIDIVLNNASALNLSGTLDLPLKRYDLMQDVNSRGTFALTQACLPKLLESENPHVLTLSPPLNLNPKWLGAHPAYTLSKYGMTLLTLGWAAEFAEQQLSSNCLWPESTIATRAVANIYGGAEGLQHARDPRMVADAAIQILSQPKGSMSGQCLIDVDVLASASITDLSVYGGTDRIDYDFFVDPQPARTA